MHQVERWGVSVQGASGRCPNRANAIMWSDTARSGCNPGQCVNGARPGSAWRFGDDPYLSLRYQPYESGKLAACGANQAAKDFIQLETEPPSQSRQGFVAFARHWPSALWRITSLASPDPDTGRRHPRLLFPPVALACVRSPRRVSIAEGIVLKGI